MVALIPKSEIEALNIDTVERAIVFAALALRAAIVGADNSNNKSRDVGLNVSINRDNTSDLDIDALLSFDAYKFYTEGGNLIDNVIEFSAITPDLSNQLNYSVTSSIPSIPNIPDYDESSINTFEKYLLYYAFVLLASIEDKNNKIVTLSFLKSSPESAKIKLNVSIPIDLDNWLLGDNYLNSVIRVVTSYQAPVIIPAIEPQPTENVLGLLTNEDLLTNEILLVNQASLLSLLTNEQLLENNIILGN